MRLAGIECCAVCGIMLLRYTNPERMNGDHLCRKCCLWFICIRFGEHA